MTPDRIRQIFKSLETGDSAAFFAHVADDVDWTVMGTHPLAGHYHSKAAYAGTFAKLGKVLPQGAQLHVEHVVVKDDEAVVELRSLATATNGMRFDNRYCMVLAFDGETIVRGRSYLDSAMVARLFEENPIASQLTATLKMRTAQRLPLNSTHAQPLKGEQPMNTNTATEYRNLPPAALTESVDERNRDEVLATYTAYLTAFRANDVSAIDRLVQYPPAYIGDGKTTLVDTFPIKPADLMAAKQWHDTKDSSHEVVFASADKAHVILRQATRIRADGSAIETVSAFYALTRTPSGWKFFALSDITIPA